MRRESEAANNNPIPYADDVRPEDTVNALQTITPTLFPDETRPWTIDFQDTCPRCGDRLQSRKWIIFVAGALKMNDRRMEALAAELDKQGVDRSPGDQTFDLVCSCDAAHPKRPT
jgi:hypothetical protein